MSLSWLLLASFVPSSTIVLPLGLDADAYFLSDYLGDFTPLDTSTLGTYEDPSSLWSVKVSLEGSAVGASYPERMVITALVFNGTDGYVEWFNGFNAPIALNDYSMIIDQKSYEFPEMMMEPLTSMRAPIQLGFPSVGPIDLEVGFVLSEPFTSLHIYDAVNFVYVEKLTWSETLTTRLGTVESALHGLRRINFSIVDQVTMDVDAWMPFPYASPLPPFDLTQWTLTPLEQAKAWATYVMFGAGMFAEGRVEEAFRALEEEYAWMLAESQLLLFSEPNTQITGINERGNEDRSTFREAVVRYNYLAARVPGSSGLINPIPSPFPILILTLIGGGLIGVFAVFTYIKSRYQTV